jgi:hypothetical protein
VAALPQISRDRVAVRLTKVKTEVTPMDQAEVPARAAASAGQVEVLAWVRAEVLADQAEAPAWVQVRAVVRALTGSLIWLMPMAMVR